MRNYFNTIKHWIVFSLVFFLTLWVLYIVYAATYSLPARVWTGSWLSSWEWNKMVDSIDYLKWEVDSTKTNIISLQSKSLKTFIWATTTTYDWVWVWWYAGWDTKCATQFWAGAKMCASGDFVNGRSNIAWWINTFVFGFHPTVSWAYLTDCNWWTSNTNVLWTYILSSGYPWTERCNISKPILCCK